MGKEKLIVSAGEIEEPSSSAVDEFSNKKDELAGNLKEQMGKRQDLDELIGEDNRAIMEDNSDNLVDFFESIFLNYDSKVFVENIFWVFKTHRSHGFQPSFWPANLNTFKEIMEQKLSRDSFKELKPFIEWIIKRIPVFVEMTNEYQK